MVADIIAKLCVFVLQGPRIFVEQFYAPETKWQGGIIVLRGQNVGLFAADMSMELTPFPPHLSQRLPKQRWLNVLCDTQDWLMTMLSGLLKVFFVPTPYCPPSFALKFSRKDRKLSICCLIARSRLDQHGTLSGKVTRLHVKSLHFYSNGPLT